MDNSGFLSFASSPRVTGVAVTEGFVDAQLGRELLSTLEVVAARPAAYGISEAQILSAIAEKRDAFDPFRIMLIQQALVTRFTGSTICGLLYIAGTVALADYITEKVNDLRKLVLSWWTGAIPFGSLVSGAMEKLPFAWALKDDEDEAAKRALKFSFANTLLSPVPAVLLNPIRSAMGREAMQVGSVPYQEPAPVASAPARPPIRPTTTAAAPANSGKSPSIGNVLANAASGALSTVAQNVLNKVISGFGFSDEERQAFYDETGYDLVQLDDER